ncbi:nucleotidyl transferase AbiEii/AbiGii toxin family protein [Embleya sp. NBC_00896]|uniref:nucleotidyl transferase AbiEii/AbiGii toxin family protein n=1 Tax=Embleya sp. NBC_00896 TaxID=2975961 RepID=UPI0038675AE0|nr:nucleotidyl transferase AbiEii/AbiGii toxin family protein [Embleya sp. NBC_00896]
MDPLHARLARVGLAAAASYGFVLAGGYAVQAHGFLERGSDDVDLFTDITDPVAFAEAVSRVAAAYRSDGFTIDVEPLGDVFARFAVIDEAGRETRVEMGCDWRSRPPAQLDIGPVLHPDDAVANKVTTLFGRAAPRDYLDVDAALASGRYTADRLLELAEEHDAGFDRAYFAQALRAVDRWPDREYAVYGVSEQQIARMRERLKNWAYRIDGS